MWKCTDIQRMLQPGKSCPISDLLSGFLLFLGKYFAIYYTTGVWSKNSTTCSSLQIDGTVWGYSSRSTWVVHHSSKSAPSIKGAELVENRYGHGSYCASVWRFFSNSLIEG
jgi:hypothetical protein